MERYIIPILLFVFAVLFFLQNGSGSGTGSYPPPIKGDWFIDQETEVYDDNIILTGNLTINAKATFVGVSLILNLTYNGEYRIELKNGSLYLYNTFISSSNSSYGYTFNVRKETTLGLFGGEIHNGGYDIYSPGLEIETDNATLYNTLFSENYIGIQCKNSKPKILGNRIINNTYGIILYNSSATIAENNFTENFFGVYANKSSPNVYNNQFYKEKHRGIWSAYSTFTVFNISMLNIYQIGIYLDNSNLTFINSTIESERYAFWFDMNSKVKCINVTFQKFNIYFKDFISLIELFWYIDVFVCWYDGLPIKNANVTFYALDGNIEKNGYTDENGWLRNVVLMEQNQSLLKKVYNTPHNITAEKDKKVGKGNITVDRNKIFSIWIDNLPPHIEVIYPKDKAIMNRTIIIINGHAWDNETGLEKIEVSFEGLSWEKANGTSTWSYPATLSEGKYKIYIRALDIAGNENTTILNITVDITPPYLYIIEPTGDVYTNISYLKIIGVTEPNATVNISLKELYLEVSIDEYGSFEVIANLFEGMNKIIVIAMDRANNTKALEINAILDTTLYPFEIYPANGTYTNERNITISGKTEEKASVLINWVEIEVVNGSFQKNLTLEEGENIITFFAIDRFGNSKTFYLTIILDTLPPELNLTNPLEIYTNKSKLMLIGKTNGSVLKINEKNVAIKKNGTFEYPITLRIGLNIIEICAYDDVNNKAELTVFATLDTTPPKINITLAKFTKKSKINVEGYTDANITVIINGMETSSSASGKFSLIIPLKIGNNTITIIAIDKAGNQCTKRIFVIREKEEEKGIDILFIIGLLLTILILILLCIFIFLCYIGYKVGRRGIECMSFAYSSFKQILKGFLRRKT